EIITIEQQRHRFEPRRGIGDAVAEVQRRRMSALAVAPEGLARDAGVVGGEGDGLDRSRAQEGVEPVQDFVLPATGEYHTCFEKGWRSNQPSSGIHDRPHETVMARLGAEDRNE